MDLTQLIFSSVGRAMQRPSGGGVQVINATPPLGPVQGKAPVVFAMPALVGHRDQLRDKLPEFFKDRGDTVFLIPVTNQKKAVVWRVFWEKGAIRLIEEYNAFSDAKALVDKGLGDEENRARILSRLSEPGFLALTAKLQLPANINTYNLMPMPIEGVSVSTGSGKHIILSIAERDPTYFDLAATPYSIKNGLGAYIPDSVIYCKPRSNTGMSHSGDCNFISIGDDPRAPKNLNVLGHSVGAAALTPAFAVTVSGYTNTPLIKFEKWRPTVAAIDHESRTVYYCGVRLDEASAGNKTVCVVMICKPEGKKGSFHVSPLPGPYGHGDVNSLPPAIFENLAG